MKVSAVVDNVPFDEHVKGVRGKKRKYPFYEMAVGESVLIKPCSPDEYTADKNMISTLLSQIKKRYKMSFAIRAEGTEKRPAFRVWRVL